MVHETVQATVLAWANAPDFKSASEVLSRARASMEPEQLAQLRTEVVEINVEGFVEVLFLEKGIEGEPNIEIEGLFLYKKQLERLSAWINDQANLAEALGLQREIWGRMVDGAMKRYLSRQSDPAISPQATGIDIDQARRLLGHANAQAFEARPESGKGFASLLATRSKQQKPD